MFGLSLAGGEKGFGVGLQTGDASFRGQTVQSRP